MYSSYLWARNTLCLREWYLAEKSLINVSQLLMMSIWFASTLISGFCMCLSCEWQPFMSQSVEYNFAGCCHCKMFVGGGGTTKFVKLNMIQNSTHVLVLVLLKHANHRNWPTDYHTSTLLSVICVKSLGWRDPIYSACGNWVLLSMRK